MILEPQKLKSGTVSTVSPSISHEVMGPDAMILFPGGSEGKASACNAGDLGLIPESGRSPGGKNGYSLQYSCLENSMDRGA